MGAALLALDSKLFCLINSGLACRFLDTTMPVVTDFFIWRFPLLILAVILFFAQDGKHRALILTIALAAGLTDQVSSRFIKKMIKRPRPCCAEPLDRKFMGRLQLFSFSSRPSNSAVIASVVLCMPGGIAGIPKLLLFDIGCLKSFSFPSSHAANTAAVAAIVLCMRGWLMGFPVLLLSLIVSFSRVYVGVHYPVDVLYGMLLGLFLGVLVFRGCRFLWHRLPLFKRFRAPPDFDQRN